MAIVRRTFDLSKPFEPTPEQEARLRHHRELGDEGIDTDDIPEVPDWMFESADATMVPIDRDVVEWFQARGGDYRERIGDVLRQYRERKDRDGRTDDEAA